MEPVPIESLDYPGDGLHYQAGKPFTGVAVIRATHGGWVEAEEEYKEGLLSGVTRTWHAPGRLAVEKECAEGVRHGRYREWSDQGQLIDDSKYEYGIRTEGKRWNTDGELIEDFRLQETDPAFRTLRLARKAYEEDA